MLLNEFINLYLFFEGRIEDAKAKYPHLSSAIDELTASDPSSSQKYLMWSAKMLDQDSSIDAEDVSSLLRDFQKQVGKIKEKDINFFKTFNDLKNAVEKAKETKTGQEKRKLEKAEGADSIYDDGRFVVFHIKTLEATCHYGAGTKWCISSRDESHFKNYSSKNVIFYFVIDRNPENENLKKIAVAVKRDKSNKILGFEFYDAEDDLISSDKVLSEIKNAIKSHVSRVPKNSLAKLLSIENVSKEELLKFAKDEDVDIRVLAAQNPNASKEIFEILIKDKNWIVREAIAKNLKTPKEILEILAKDEDSDVQKAVAKNPNYKK